MDFFSTLSFVLLFAASAAVRRRDDCSPTWQENRDSHVPTDLTGDHASVFYLAEVLKDDQVGDAVGTVHKNFQPQNVATVPVQFIVLMLRDFYAVKIWSSRANPLAC